MPLDRAELYRKKAEECLEQAELFKDETLKSRMREMAEKWLRMAAAASGAGPSPAEDRGGRSKGRSK